MPVWEDHRSVRAYWVTAWCPYHGRKEMISQGWLFWCISPQHWFGVWTNRPVSHKHSCGCSNALQIFLLGTLLMARSGLSTRTVRMADRLALWPSREYSITLKRELHRVTHRDESSTLCSCSTQTSKVIENHCGILTRPWRWQSQAGSTCHPGNNLSQRFPGPPSWQPSQQQRMQRCNHPMPVCTQ